MNYFMHEISLEAVASLVQLNSDSVKSQLKYFNDPCFAFV